MKKLEDINMQAITGGLLIVFDLDGSGGGTAVEALAGAELIIAVDEFWEFDADSEHTVISVSSTGEITVFDDGIEDAILSGALAILDLQGVEVIDLR